MPLRLHSLGLKLNLALVLFFIVLGAATATFVFVGFNRTRDNATNRSQEALEQLGRQNLSEIANTNSNQGALQLEWAAEIGHRAARYLEAFRAGNGALPFDVSRLTRTPQGTWIDNDPERIADLLIIRENLDPDVLDDLAYSAPLAALFPALSAGFPGEIRAESFHPLAIIYVGASGMGWYYPPKGAVYASEPSDFNMAAVFDDMAPEVNPERRTVWTPPYQDLVGQGMVITAKTPVYQGDTFRGMIEVDLAIGPLAQTVDGIRPTDSGFAFYVDVDGQILRTAAYDLLINELQSQENGVLAGIVDRMKVGERGIERMEMGGQEFFVAYAPIQQVGGGLAVVAPIAELTSAAAAITAEIDHQANQTMTFVLTSMTALFAVALVGATYLNRRMLIRPIEALVGATRRVAEGRFDTTIPVRGDDELAALGHSFNQMTAGILQREESLQREVREREAAQEELRALFAAMTDRVLVFDRDGKFLRLPMTNAPPLDIPLDTLPGMTLHDIVPEDQAERILSHIRRSLSERITMTEEYPYEMDGRTLWFSSAISPISDSEVVMVSRDITERVAARQELERLVAERTRELSTLLTVSRNVATTLELGPLLQMILDQVKDISDYTRCSIFTVEGESIVLLDSRSLAGSSSINLRIPLDVIEPLWQPIREGRAAVIDDVRGDSPMAIAYRRGSGDLLETAFRDIRAWMGVPLIAKDRLIGMLTVSHTQPAYFTEHHAGLISGVATQIAVAIENARLYEQAQQLAAVEERQRLARELHDSVSQALYGISLGARTARTLMDRDPTQALEPMDYVLSLAEAGLAEMRALIFELRPESLEQEGLVAALEKQVAATSARYGLEVVADLCPEPELSLSQREAFYRIAQEALHNVVKHARATRAEVRLRQGDDSIILEVSDNGSGFDTSESFPGHMGLVSMTERAGGIGATLSLSSQPGNGTTVSLTLPLGVPETKPV